MLDIVLHYIILFLDNHLKFLNIMVIPGYVNVCKTGEDKAQYDNNTLDLYDIKDESCLTDNID